MGLAKSIQFGPPALPPPAPAVLPPYPPRPERGGPGPAHGPAPESQLTPPPAPLGHAGLCRKGGPPARSRFFPFFPGGFFSFVSSCSRVFGALFFALQNSMQSVASSPRSIESGKSFELTIEASDPSLAGRGPARTIEHDIDFMGKLYAWVSSSEIDPFVRASDASKTTLGEDDNGGGGTTACLILPVEKGTKLFLTIAQATPGAGGKVRVCVNEAPETEATIAAAKSAEQHRQQAEKARDVGDLNAARTILSEAVKQLSTVPGHERSGQLCRAASDLGFAAYGLLEMKTAHDAWAIVLAFHSCMLPDDHHDLQGARVNLALTLEALGDLRGARNLEETVLEVFSRTRPDDDPELSGIRLNLGATLFSLGELARAHDLFDKVVDVCSRTLPDDHPDLQAARKNLAVVMETLGDLKGARELEEKVLGIYLRTLREDDPELQGARQNLAVTLERLGDYYAARELDEKVLEVRTRRLPDDHSDLQAARQNLALVMSNLGDLEGARALQEMVLHVLSRTMPDDHPDLQMARSNLAVTLVRLGNFDRARELDEKVLEVFSGTLSDDHPDLQAARTNLATTLLALGDPRSARELIEEVLAVRLRSLPEDHPDLQSARSNLAQVLFDLGDLRGADELLTRVVEVRSRTLPDEHHILHSARENLLWTVAALEKHDDVENLGVELARSLRASILCTTGSIVSTRVGESSPCRNGLALEPALDRRRCGVVRRARGPRRRSVLRHGVFARSRAPRCRHRVVHACGFELAGLAEARGRMRTGAGAPRANECAARRARRSAPELGSFAARAHGAHHEQSGRA